MSVIPESWRGTEENPKIKANLGYRRPCLKKIKARKKVSSYALHCVISHTDWHSIEQRQDMRKRRFHHLKAAAGYSAQCEIDMLYCTDNCLLMREVSD